MKLLLKTHKTTLFSLALCISLLVCRIIITQSIYFSFLLWNLCLAAIPLMITKSLQIYSITNKFILFLSLIFWLLFIPNAPYIVTDLVHLKRSLNQNLWLDLIVIFTFAFTGLYLFYKSYFQMKQLLIPILSESLTKKLMPILFYLISFGIYLGRVLRYNSWDIIHPKSLLTDCLIFISQPIVYIEVWQFTFLFGSLLFGIYQGILQSQKKIHEGEY